MKVVELSNERINDFIDYCKRHRGDVDDSFLYDEDLEKFQVNEDNPTYIIIDNNGKIIAAASLILDEYNRSGKKGRFRIFHSEINEISLYKSLLQGILKQIEGLERIFTFVPTYNKELMDNIAGLNFMIERYVFLLLRELDNIPNINLPNDYTIRPLELNRDEENWCQVRNAAFATVKGNENPVTPNMVKDMILSTDNLAKALYIQEGYKQVEAVVCYYYEI